MQVYYATPVCFLYENNFCSCFNTLNCFTTEKSHFLLVDSMNKWPKLKTSYSLNGVIRVWISSYLANRTQCIHSSGSGLAPLLVFCGVPALGPLLPIYSRYSTAVRVDWTVSTSVCWQHSDLWFLSTMRRRQSTFTASLIVSWPSLTEWMWSNWLQLNAFKTEVLKCMSPRPQSQLPSSSIAVGSNSLTPVLLPPWHCIWQQNCSMSQTSMHIDDCALLADQCSLHLASLMLPLVTTSSWWLLQPSSVWHSQPDQPVQTSLSLSVLRSRLKTELWQC